jgi:hypothetical protein
MNFNFTWIPISNPPKSSPFPYCFSSIGYWAYRFVPASISLVVPCRPKGIFANDNGNYLSPQHHDAGPHGFSEPAEPVTNDGS